MDEATPEQKEKARILAREEEKMRESEASGEVRVSGVDGLKVGMLLGNKEDPSKVMRVARIHRDIDVAVLVPHIPGANRHQRRKLYARNGALGKKLGLIT